MLKQIKIIKNIIFFKDYPTILNSSNLCTVITITTYPIIIIAIIITFTTTIAIIIIITTINSISTTINSISTTVITTITTTSTKATPIIFITNSFPKQGIPLLHITPNSNTLSKNYFKVNQSLDSDC